MGKRIANAGNTLKLFAYLGFATHGERKSNATATQIEEVRHDHS